MIISSDCIPIVFPIGSDWLPFRSNFQSEILLPIFLKSDTNRTSDLYPNWIISTSVFCIIKIYSNQIHILLLSKIILLVIGLIYFTIENAWFEQDYTKLLLL